MNWTDLRARSTIISANKQRWIDKNIDVIRLICEGYTSKEIGDMLFKSPRTIDAKVEELIIIFDARNRVNLAYLICKAGIA